MLRTQTFQTNYCQWSKHLGSGGTLKMMYQYLSKLLARIHLRGAVCFPSQHPYLIRWYFFSPFTLTGKRILQAMCQGNIGQNDSLPAERLIEWQTWIKDLRNLDFIKVPRWLVQSNFGKATSFVLHHLSNASTNGFGQCTYLRAVNGWKVHCAIVIAKAREVPLKVVTIPRLEFTAACQ